MKQEMMKAGVLTGPQQIEIRQASVPAMAPGMIKIRVSACGVCGSDIHMWKAGKGWSSEPIADFHMGHEFCGVVTDPGDSGFQVGDRVENSPRPGQWRIYAVGGSFCAPPSLLSPHVDSCRPRL